MGKTSDFANGFASNIPVDGIEWDLKGTELNITLNNEDTYKEYIIKLKITKNYNKAELWFNCESGEKFIGRCSGDNQVELSKKLTSLFLEELDDHKNKKASEEANGGLCDYLTSELVKCGFKVTNKSISTENGSYAILGPSGKEYLIRATYKDSKVVTNVVNNSADILGEVSVLDLSNPEIEKKLCNVLCRYDRSQITKDEKDKLRNKIQELITNKICLDDEFDEWNIRCNGKDIECETKDKKFKIKFELCGIVLGEINDHS